MMWKKRKRRKKQKKRKGREREKRIEMRNRVNKVQENSRKAKQSKEQARVMCIECDTYYDMDEGGNEWIECEICLNWYHTTCVDVSEDDLNFICKLCS